MPLEQEMPVQFRVVELPGAHHLCKVRALNKGDANFEVTVYYQSGARSLERIHSNGAACDAHGRALF